MQVLEAQSDGKGERRRVGRWDAAWTEARSGNEAALFNPPLHLERLDDARHDTSADGNVAGEGALLVNVLELARLGRKRGREDGIV